MNKIDNIANRPSKRKRISPETRIMKFLALGLLTIGMLTACSGNASAPQSPDFSQQNIVVTPYAMENFTINLNNVPPEIAFLSMVTRLPPEQLTAIVDPNKRDIFSLIVSANAKNTAGAGSYDPKNTIGLLDCSDSRVCMPSTFTNVNTKATLMTDPVTGQTLTVSKIGAQPSLFPTDITQTVFIPHQTGDCLPGGCGALGGVETLVNSEEGTTKLLQHGVSPMTIENIKTLIAQGAGSNPGNAETMEEAWAQIGARMQAEINHAQFRELNPAAADQRYYSAWGVFGHADNSFKVGGVIDDLGYVHSLDEFPLLKAFAGYINTPHPMIEALTSQAPDIIAINGSRLHDTNKMFGELAEEPGILFKSSVNMTPGVPLSVDEAREVIAGGDYAVGALKNSKFITLIADTRADMDVLRTTLMTEGVQDGSMKAFFDQGGIVVELFPDKTGRFSGLANILTSEDLATDYQKLAILTRPTVASTVNIDGGLIGQLQKSAARNLELGIINEEQYNKYISLLDGLRPISPFFKYGLQMVGDYFMIHDAATWIDESVMGHNLIWENPATPGANVIWTANNPIILTETQNQIKGENLNANPYLIEGRLDHIEVKQNDLVSAYSGAIRAYMDHGPQAPASEQFSPWKDFSSPLDVGKLLTLEVLPPFGPADGTPLKLLTTLVIKRNGTDYVQDDPNQVMRLEDQVTGLSIYGDIPGQSMTVSAADPNNPDVKYLFEVSTSVSQNAKDSHFDFRFIGVTKVHSTTGAIQNKDTTPFAFERQSFINGNDAQDPFEGLIPVLKGNIFSFREKQDAEKILI